MFASTPEVVCAIACMVPSSAVVSPAAPFEPSMMPVIRMSMPFLASTPPEEIFFDISSVVTPNSLAKMVRPFTPPAASWLIVSIVILPVDSA